MCHIWAECIMSTAVCMHGNGGQAVVWCVENKIEEITPHTHTHTHLHSRPRTQTHSPRECQEILKAGELIFPSLAESFASSWALLERLHLRAGRWGCVRRNMMMPLILWLIFPPLSWMFIKAFAFFSCQFYFFPSLSNNSRLKFLGYILWSSRSAAAFSVNNPTQWRTWTQNLSFAVSPGI